MGFQLFETSGTFNPTTWGLKVGDCIHIVCMGGGGGGGGSSYSSSETSAGHTTGTAGGTSSFGSVISSAGGSGGGASVGSSGGAKGASFSGAGAGGWMPNVCLPSPGLEDVVEGYIPISGGSVGKGVTLAGSTGFYVTPDDNSGDWSYSNGAIAATRYYAGCG